MLLSVPGRRESLRRERLRAEPVSLGASEQVGCRDAETVSDADKVIERDVAFAALDLAGVGAVKPGFEREPFLAEPGFVA